VPSDYQQLRKKESHIVNTTFTQPPLRVQNVTQTNRESKSKKTFNTSSQPTITYARRLTPRSQNTSLSSGKMGSRSKKAKIPTENGDLQNLINAMPTTHFPRNETPAFFSA
jgi:hypothetical protein